MYKIKSLIAKGLKIDKLPVEMQEEIDLIKILSDDFETDDAEAKELDLLIAKVIEEKHADLLTAEKPKVKSQKPKTKEPAKKKPAAKPTVQLKIGDNVMKGKISGVVASVSADQKHVKLKGNDKEYLMKGFKITKESAPKPEKKKSVSSGAKTKLKKEKSKKYLNDQDQALEDCKEKIKASRPPRKEPVHRQKTTVYQDAAESFSHDVSRIIEDRVKDDPKLRADVQNMISDFVIKLKKRIFGIKATRISDKDLKEIVVDQLKEKACCGVIIMKHGGSIESILEPLFNQFPDNAENWGQATGELSEMHSRLAYMYNDRFDKNYKKHEGVSKSPSESNKRHKAGIKELYAKLPEQDQKDFLKFYDDWFKKGGNIKTT